MKHAGAVNWRVTLVLVVVLLFLGVAFFSGSSPASSASSFLGALQKGDVDTLVDLSYVPEKDRAAIREQWKYTVTKAAPYYNFYWTISHSKQIGTDQAVVAIQAIRNPERQNAYEEPYEIPMVKDGKRWKVDVYRLNRAFYPFLPRIPTGATGQ